MKKILWRHRWENGLWDPHTPCGCHKNWWTFVLGTHGSENAKNVRNFASLARENQVRLQLFILSTALASLNWFISSTSEMNDPNATWISRLPLAIFIRVSKGFSFFWEKKCLKSKNVDAIVNFRVLDNERAYAWALRARFAHSQHSCFAQKCNNSKLNLRSSMKMLIEPLAKLNVLYNDRLFTYVKGERC